MCPGPPWAKERNLIIFWAHKLFRTQWGQDLGPDGTRLRPPVAHEKVCVPHLPCGPMKETLNICVAHNFFRRLWVCDIGGGGMGEICAPRRFPLTHKGNNDYFWAHKLFRTQRDGISVHRSSSQKTGRLVKALLPSQVSVCNIKRTTHPIISHGCQLTL